MAIQSRDQVEVSAVRRFAPVLAALVGMAVVAIGVVILADRNASTNLLGFHLRGDREHPGRSRPGAWRRRPAAGQARAGPGGAGGRGRRDLDALHRRKRRGRSAESQMAGPDPALGVRHPGRSSCSSSTSSTRRSGRSSPASRSRRTAIRSRTTSSSRHRSSSASSATTSSGSSSPPAEASCSAS